MSNLYADPVAREAHQWHLRKRIDDPRCVHCVVSHLGEPGRKSFAVISTSGRLVLETDEWVEAQDAALWKQERPREYPSVYGVHPSHEWNGTESTAEMSSWLPQEKIRRCTKCGAWDNGSYGSQSPCDYDWSRDSLFSAVQRELAARESGAPPVSCGDSPASS